MAKCNYYLKSHKCTIFCVTKPPFCPESTPPKAQHKVTKLAALKRGFRPVLEIFGHSRQRLCFFHNALQFGIVDKNCGRPGSLWYGITTVCVTNSEEMSVCIGGLKQQEDIITEIVSLQHCNFSSLKKDFAGLERLLEMYSGSFK